MACHEVVRRRRMVRSFESRPLPPEVVEHIWPPCDGTYHRKRFRCYRNPEQSDVEEALYAAAMVNSLVADDGERQCAVQLHRHRPLVTFIVTPPAGLLFSRPVASAQRPRCG
jgi:hypothetical protein